MNATPLTRVALVTGASRGIGAAVARRLARDGFSVAVNYASSGAEADALVAELRAGGAAALAVRADIGRADDVRRMFDAVERQLGRVDVLVNNAGILKTGPLADATDDAFDRIFDINVVNVVAPGPVATSLFLEGKTDEQIQGYAKMPPLERLGEPEDIAGVVSFLAGPDGGWVNAQVLRANGGLA
ncbi:SDR family oxidoreductase [Burkholderia pseudomallei]